MADEQRQDVTPNSSSALADAIASSPEALEEQQSQGTEAGTPQQPESQGQQEQQTQEEVPAHLIPRFKEVVDEKNWYKQQMERMLQERQPQQQFQQPTQQPPQELGNTPEEREFWRMQRQIAREEAQRVTQEQLGQIKPVIDAGRMELAQMKVQQFRTIHPDIKPNSSEEIAIAEKIQMGYLPEDAYRSVMWDSRVANAEKQGNINVKQKIEAKKQANVENRSIPSGGTSPTKDKLTLRQRIERAATDMGL